MTVATPLRTFEPARQLPNGKLFYSPEGVYAFQAEHIAKGYLKLEPGSDGGLGLIWQTGLGKTIFSLVMAAWLYEDDKIDQVIVCCERNKKREWLSDVEKFTALSAMIYHGTGRENRLIKKGIPHVLITVHETGRNDLMRRVKTSSGRGKGKHTDGPLMDALGLRDRRVLWIFDEPKMRNRSSEIYHAYWYVLGQLRKGPHHQRVIALTATPYERDIEDAFNLGRFLAPLIFPSVGDFENYYTRGKDPFGNYVWQGGRLDEFRNNFQQIILRKRKTDPDVIDQFPQQIEKKITVELDKPQRDFYNAISTLLDPPDGEEDPRSEVEIIQDETKLRVPLRITAGHPAAHLHLDNEISRSITETIGEEGLRAIGSAKTEELIARLKPLVKGQGAQVLVFSRYTSVITEVVRELRAAGYQVGEYHGRRTNWENERDEDAFKAGNLEILFCSDKAAKGGNFPMAHYVIEYESAFTYAGRIQRMGRNNRINSKLPSTTCYTLVLDGTVEVNTFAKVIDRNKEQDVLLGDEEDETAFVGADTRREMLQAYRDRRGR